MSLSHSELSAHEKLALLGLSWIDLPETYRPSPHCSSQYRAIRSNEKGETYQTRANCKDNQIHTSQEHLPLRLSIPSFIQEQPENAAHSVCPHRHISHDHSDQFLGDSQVNQLANNAVIKLSRSLNTGIASAMIHAIVHSTSPITTHVPIERTLRWCIRSVPRKSRT